MASFLKRLPIYGVLALSAYFIVQNIYLGIEKMSLSNIQATYFRKGPRRALEPRSPPKGSQASTRVAKGFIPPPDTKEGQSKPEFTLGTWEIEYCPPQGVTFNVTLDEEGNPHATVQDNPIQIIGVGRIRELGLYMDMGWELSDELVTDREMGLYYRHDLGFTGPVHWGLEGKAGYHEVTFPDGDKLRGAKVTVSGKVGWRF